MSRAFLVPPASEAVLLPGLGLGAEAWAPTVAALAEHGVPAWVLRLPGYGLPAGPETDLRPAALGRRLAAALPTGGRPRLLVGHSASCPVAVHAALHAREAVLGVVLVGPVGDPRARTWPALARRWLATAIREDPRQAPALLRMWWRTGPASMARALDVARSDPLPDVVRRVQRPALVLRGRRDRICPADWAARLATAGAMTLPAGAHMVPLTHGGLVAGALRHLADRLR